MKRRSFLTALGLAPFVPFLAKLKPEQLPESWPEYRGQTWKQDPISDWVYVYNFRQYKWRKIPGIEWAERGNHDIIKEFAREERDILARNFRA